MSFHVGEKEEMEWKAIRSTGQELVLLIISAVVLVLFGLVFYVIDLWIVTFAATQIFGLSVSGDWLVLSAAILSAAAMIGGIGRSRRP